MKRIVFIIMGCLASCFVVQGQNKIIDSLSREYKAASNDTVKALLLADLAIEFRNINLDTTLVLARKALQLSEKNNFDKGKGRALRVTGIYYLMLGDNTQALSYYVQANEFSKKINDLYNITWAYVNIGTAYKNLGYNEKALENYMQALAMFEKMNDKKSIAWVLGNIGLMYSLQNDYSNSLKYHEKSLSIREQLGFTSDIALSLSNIGGVYVRMNQYQKALEVLLRSLDMATQAKDNVGVIRGCNQIGLCYMALNDTIKALDFLNKGLSTAQQSNNRKEITDIHISFARLYNKIKDYQKAFNHSSLALEAAKISSNIEHLRDAAYEYSVACSNLSNYKEAYESYVLFKKSSDSLTNERLYKRTLQMDFRYQTEKQQLEQEKKDIETKAKLDEERIIRNTILFCFFGLLVFAFYVYRSYKAKQKANQLLHLQNVEINQQKEEISAQSDKLELTNKQLTKQKVEIEQQNEMIRGSIRYALTIQKAILPSLNEIQRFFDAFIFYHPKDIVSGDFYWFSVVEQAEKSNPYIFIAVVDCTGHGVPGAFMSMVGSRLLNAIVNEKQITNTSEILQQLNKGVKSSLNQDVTHNNDGMDICLCRIEKTADNHYNVMYAGAFLSLYYYTHSENGIQSIKGNRWSIGGYSASNDNEYASTSIVLHPNDTLYLMSDGIIDQNDSQRKRFGSGRMVEVLQKSVKMPLQEQQQYINTTIKQYQGSEEQRDDMTLIGIKLR